MSEHDRLKLATRIAKDLFTNGMKERADRLALMSKDGRDLGGWGLEPMRDRIANALEQQAERGTENG